MENLFEEGAETEKTEFQVLVVKLGKIEKHPGADTLSIVDVDGYPVIIKTDSFKEGDLAVYVPVDALVPLARPEFSFLTPIGHPERSQHRVKAARLRGIFSMGLLVPLSQKAEMAIETQPGLYVTVKVGLNVQSLLGIEKFIPIEERRQLGHVARTEAQKRARAHKGPKLPVYGLDPLRRYAASLPMGTEVVITEKIHGCNSRFVYSNGRLWVGSHKAMRGCSRNRLGEWLERMKIKLFTFLGIQHRAHTLAELGDIWWECAEGYELKQRLEKLPGLVLYGEIYGEGVQDLTYDSPQGRKLRIFDLYDLEAKRFLDYDEFRDKSISVLGFKELQDFVPVLYRGPWTENVKALYQTLANTGKSTLNPNQICEGVAIKPVKEIMDPRCGRVGLKYVGEGYLLRDDKKGNTGGKAAKYKKDKAAGFPNGDRVERSEAPDEATDEVVKFEEDQNSIKARIAAHDRETAAAIKEGRLMPPIGGGQ